MKTIKKVKQVQCGFFAGQLAADFVREAIRKIHKGHWKSDDPSSIEAHYRQRFKITIEVINEDD